MNELLSRPELALSAALVVALLWLALAYWLAFRNVGDEVGQLSARLDALQPKIDFAELPMVERRRDYSGDRGPCPRPARRFATVYDELVSRLGDPLGA